MTLEDWATRNYRSFEERNKTVLLECYTGTLGKKQELITWLHRLASGNPWSLKNLILLYFYIIITIFFFLLIIIFLYISILRPSSESAFQPSSKLILVPKWKVFHVSVFTCNSPKAANHASHKSCDEAGASRSLLMGTAFLCSHVQTCGR